MQPALFDYEIKPVTPPAETIDNGVPIGVASLPAVLALIFVTTCLLPGQPIRCVTLGKATIVSANSWDGQRGAIRCTEGRSDPSGIPENFSGF
jgi:hypothetical protein